MADVETEKNTQPDEAGEQQAEQAKPSRLRRVMRFVRRVVLVCLVLGAIALAWMLQLARTEPEAFVAYDHFLESSSPREIHDLSEQASGKLQNLVKELDVTDTATATSAVQEGNSGLELDELASTNEKEKEEETSKFRTLQMTSDELNAMLITSMNDWADERGYEIPPQVSDPMIAFEGDEIVIGFRVNIAGVVQSITAPVRLKFLDNGMMRITVEQYSAGTLPIPADSLGSWLAKKAPHDTNLARAGRWLDKLHGMEIKPVIKLESRHRAWVTGFKLKEKGIELSMRIDPPKKY